MFSNWDKILANPWSAVGYVASGAVGGAVATINPALGRSIAAAGNVATDVASGNIPSFDGIGDVAAYGGGIALDAFSVGGAGKIGNLANTSLKNAAKQGAKEIGGEVLGSGAFGQDLVFESSLDIITNSGSLVPFGTGISTPIISASTPSLLGTSFATGLGATVSNGISIDPSNQVDRSLLNKPNKPGNAPTFKSDGSPVEIHHEGPEGPFKEMHRDAHRGKGNFNKNHPPGQHQALTKAQRKKFNSQRKSYWRKIRKLWK